MTRGFLRFLRGNTIALLALFLALGGTTYAATALPKNSVGTKQLKKNAVTAPKIKNSAVTNAKIGANAVTGAKVKDDSLTGADVLESSLGTVPSATNASKAANATNAASAANAAKLGGIDAASYVKNTGMIFVSTGSSNWQALHTTDPISWSYTVNATWATSSGAGSWFLTAHPSFSTALYGKNLSATAATLCYSASGSAAISEVDIYRSRYSNSGIGSPSLIASDATDRTDAACRTYTFTSPQALSSLDDIGFVVQATYTGAASLLIGQSGLTLAPTTAVAAAPTSAAQEAHLPTPAAGIVTH
jgi:hypothetical protein